MKRGLYFEWLCESRIDTMDYEMLRWMRKAGCVKIAYGLESGSPDMLVTMKKGVTQEKVIRGAKLNRELGMYFKFFMLYGFPEEKVQDHRISEQIVSKTRPDSVCVSLLQPIPGTTFYEQIKPYLTQDVAEVEFHYWHSTECFKHPNFTHEELHAERERLIKTHAKATKGIVPKIHRKLERAIAMFKHPELIGDWFEIKRRKRKHQQRVAKTEWKYVVDGSNQKDVARQQVPTLGKTA